MPRIVRPVALACLLVAASAPPPALAGTLAAPVDCQIENLSPTVAVGAQASYIVHLIGGLGSYGVTLRYGDGSQDARSVSGSSSSFDHWFAATGTYLQSATVSGAGSTATCGSSTTVY